MAKATKVYASFASAKRGLAMAVRAGRNVKIFRESIGTWILVNVTETD